MKNRTFISAENTNSKHLFLRTSNHFPWSFYKDRWYHVGGGSHWHGMNNTKDTKRIEIGYEIVKKILQ